MIIPSISSTDVNSQFYREIGGNMIRLPNQWISFQAIALCMGLVCPLVMPVGASSTSIVDIGFSKPYTWLFGGWVAPPRLPLLVDVNGDGYADFLYASPADKLIDVSINGHGLKPLRGQRFLQDLPQPILSMCKGQPCGKTAAIFTLGADGALTKALPDEKGNYAATSLGSVSNVKGKGWLITGKVISTDKSDLAVVTPDGAVRLVDPQTGRPIRQIQLPGGIIAAATGDSDGDGRVEMAVQTRHEVTLYRLGEEETQKLVSLRCPKGQPTLAMGDVNADGKADLLVNGCVFLGPDFKNDISIEGWESFCKPALAFLADVNADGKDDVVVQHEGSDYCSSRETDCNVYLAYRQSDPDWDDDGLSNAEENELGTDPLNRDTDCDGLLDGWEVHVFGDSDFPGMGASPLHKDIFVMNLPTSSSLSDRIRQYMNDTVMPFFARLPYKNLDGTQGFAIHFIVMPSVSAEQTNGKSWEQLADESFPGDCIGSWHWMEILGMFGGGQSGLLSDVGSTGMVSWIHELGHQLGLTHSGKWGASSPTYTSLMNYAYCSQFNGRCTNIHFSTGELAALVLNEQRLSEKIPYPYNKLEFLAGNPYEFRIKALSPNETWVDWNWNGILDDKPVKADVTWGECVDLGLRFNSSGRPVDVGGAFDDYTDFAPELVVHDGKLYYLVIKRLPIDPGEPHPSSGPLVMYRYQSNHCFGAATEVDPAATSVPSAVSDGKTLYIFYLTSEGVMYRFGQPDDMSKAYSIPESKDLQVRAFVWKGTVFALLYSGADGAVRYCLVRQGTLGSIHDLGFKSTIPPGPVIDTIHQQLLLGTAQAQGNMTYRWQLRRFAWDEKAGVFKQVSWEWLGGEKSGWRGNTRPGLIFDASPDAGPDGRIFFFGRGFSDGAAALANVFMAQSVAYKDYNDGWLLKRIGDFSYQSRQAPGVAWFNSDIALAGTWGSNTAQSDGGVFLCYRGMGIAEVDMADFDDISMMADYGISRSIGTFVQMPTENTTSK